MCRSRRELSNEYLLAKIGVDTGQNEPLDVWGENSIQCSLHSLITPRNAPNASAAKMMSFHQFQSISGKSTAKTTRTTTNASKSVVEEKMYRICVMTYSRDPTLEGVPQTLSESYSPLRILFFHHSREVVPFAQPLRRVVA